MSIGPILLIENETILVQQLREHLHQREHEVTVVPSLAAAGECLAEHDFDLILTEVALPDGSAAELLRQLQTRPVAPPVMVISEFGSVESAMDCLRLGAVGYLLKPFSRAQVEVNLDKAEAHLRLVRLTQLLSREPDADGGWELLGESSAMRLLRQTVRQVARTDATVLISGESGTGKERIARAIYAQSLRAGMPLVKVDCAHLPEHRLAMEMFGREPGTDRERTAPTCGRFELANHGTVLLDEISEISAEVQAGLLRVLQDQTVQRIGATRGRRVDVRVLATTSRSLEEAVQRQQFREDLYLRLNIVPVAIPPLRDRKSDIPMLAEHFRQRFVRKHQSAALAISPECIDALQKHAWPGNVRELKNVIERAVMACVSGNVLEPSHLDSLIAPLAAAGAAPPPPPAQVPDDLDTVEKQHILAVVEKCGGNRTHAAKRLGISIRTLRNKLKEYREETERAAVESSVEESPD